MRDSTADEFFRSITVAPEVGPVQPGAAMTVQGDEPGRSRSGFSHIQRRRMAGYIIDIWKDGELVQSVSGKWVEDEARRLTMYYLGYYRGERAQLLRERSPSCRPAQNDR